MQAFSIVEMMLSLGILGGVMLASSYMFKSHQDSQWDIERKGQAITIYSLLGKIFTRQDTCNAIFIGNGENSDVASTLRTWIPEELRRSLTIQSALVSNVASNTTAPFQLDVNLSYEDINQNVRQNSYRFFIEARTDGGGIILYCHTIFAAFLATYCDLMGGQLVSRDQDGDGVAHELSCQLRVCDDDPLDALYDPPNTSPTNLTLNATDYQDHHATSRYCFVRHVDFFLNVVSGSDNYLLQNADDTMAGSLQGSSVAPVPSFATQTQLQAQRWCIGNSCRTVLASGCPSGYVSGIDENGNMDCTPNPLPSSCTIVCPLAGELCRNFVYTGHNGCGGSCNVTGLRPPACVSGPDPDTSRCIGTTRVVGNGCGDNCTLTGTNPGTCPITTDSNVCSGTSYTIQGTCPSLTCIVNGTKTDGHCASPPTPTPSPTFTVGSTPTPMSTPMSTPTPTPTQSSNSTTIIVEVYLQDDNNYGFQLYNSYGTPYQRADGTWTNGQEKPYKSYGGVRIGYGTRTVLNNYYWTWWLNF